MNNQIRNPKNGYHPGKNSAYILEKGTVENQIVGTFLCDKPFWQTFVHVLLKQIKH